MPRLGKLQKVDPREIWPQESDFTKWLKENSALLSEIVGLDLEISEEEGPVGDFSVDLVGTELGSNRPIVIENQLEATDHDHLGKLITYAAGRNAGVAIWIARNFRDEHRQALEFLNSITENSRQFFGVQLEVLRIGNSEPAPNFDVVVRPLDWEPPISETARQRNYREFFTELLEKVKKEMPGFTSAKKAPPQSWLSLGAGRTHFQFLVSFAQRNRFRVELYISVAARRGFDLLYEQKQEIEGELGEELAWENLPRDRRIAVYTRGSIADPPQALGALQDWAVIRLKKFDGTFRHRIAELPRSLAEPEEDKDLNQEVPTR